jgi:CRP/FNR family transcriptional regulator, cyclic AMP receptor protein
MLTRSQVLLEDPDLAGHLTGEGLVAAVRDGVARTVHVPAGPWSPRGLAGTADGIGLLILDGLVVRRAGLGGRFGAELLGDGDLLRPWQREDTGTTLPRTGRWQALLACRIAVLDRDFAARMGRYPEVVARLFARAVRRSRHTVLRMAIVHQPRVDVRLQMLFWELADRWGTVHADGVRVPLQLTHQVLAELVAARRPTVSKALGELAARSAVVWTGRDWLLSGQPPAELSVGSISIGHHHRSPDSGRLASQGSHTAGAAQGSDTGWQNHDQPARHARAGC